ncbi:hypothetical protein J7E50_21280 [Pedobacter sp. ISL-68]|uniref:hypothetical protein n=1 Tax=unclassified Pedobacter TaxID=2628915 RepID=UPI001BE717B7|nr:MULTISPECIES: hypothetical protein [unclassified Pedobacter]MBT2563829.1 hypothetical protein [Pedobacter sp. ISL-64]MBT2592765.1 hypothetical protein [Pedobacter sp. ISL-68]
MKLKIFTLFFLSAFVTLSLSCRKAELLQPEPAKIIQLSVTGSTNVELEYLYKDSIIATPPAGGISLKTLLAVKDQNAVLKIRKKGTSEILLTRTITAAPFDQNISIFYDGTKIYNNAISLEIKGYALSGELEFLLDGNVISSETGKVNKVLSILIDKGTTREIQIRKKGETAILFTKTIESTIPKQDIGYLFDGTKIVDNVKLDPPKNPANMIVSAKFETTFPNQFKNLDVDLVFYTRLKTASNTTVGTKVMPELRFTLPKDGSFNSIELPPLPGSNYIYSFDIVEKGTNNDPYNPTSPLVPNGFTLKPNEGRITSAFANDGFNFQAGTSKLFLIIDAKTTVTSPTRSIYVSGGKLTDLSQYFQ